MPHHRLTRRALLTGSAALAAEAAAREPDVLQVQDIVAGSGRSKRPARLLVPAGASGDRLLILLHGKGETRSEALGLRAWSDMYGLKNAFERLRAPPVQPVLDRPRITDRRLRSLNTDLHESPFRGLAVVCPTTPNPGTSPDRGRLFDDYSAWLLDALVPKVRQTLGTPHPKVGLDGVSMGGYVALEVLTRAATAFSSFGTVQSAIGEHRVPGYVERLRPLASNGHEPLPIHLQTSTYDPFKKANELLSNALADAGVKNRLEIIVGGHDQNWLRQIGTLEMLYWHDRHL